MSTAPVRLERAIGLGSAIAVVVGSTIGSGIFRTPASIAEKVPDALPMLGVWVAAGLFVLCGALTLAEIGSAFPYAGGLYVFLREAYGRALAFTFGWAQLILIRPAANGAVALVFAEYALRLGGWERAHPRYELAVTLLAAGAIVVVAAANYRGVQWGAWLQNLTTIAKTGGLLVLIALAFAVGAPEGSATAAATATSAPASTSFTISAFGLAVVSAMWPYDGWADVSYVGGEVADPKRNVPRAILAGTAIIIGIYILANVAYLAVFSVQEIAASKEVAADAMDLMFGAPGLTFIVATVMLSTFGTLNGSMLTAPRIYFAMAEDRMFFKPIAKVHPRFHTPHISTILAMVLAITFLVIAKLPSDQDAFTRLTDAFVIGLVPFYALSVAAVFVFRSKRARAAGKAQVGGASELPPDVPEPPELAGIPERPAYEPSVRTPLYPLVPIVFIASTLVLIGNALWDPKQRTETLITLGIVALGVPIYYATVGRLGSGKR